MKIYVYIMVLFTIGYAGVHYGAGRTLRRLVSPAFYFAIASTYLVAVVTPWAFPLLLWAAAMMFVGVRSRVEVACRYILLLPLMPSITPLLSLGSHSIGQYSPADFAGIGALIAGVTIARAPAPAWRGLSAEDAVIALLVLIFGVLAVRFDDISLLLRSILSEGIALGVPFWIIRRNIRTREELQLLAGCVGAVAAILSVFALYEHHAGWVLFDPMSERFANGMFIARSSVLRGGALRASASLGGPIELGIVLMLGLMGLLCARRLFTNANAWTGLLALTFVGLLTTQSRGALIAVVMGTFVILLVQRRFAAAATIGAAAVGGYGMLKALAISSRRVAAFMGEGQQVGNYKDYRTLLLERGLEEGRKHPWFGRSLSDVYDQLQDLMQGEHIIDLVNSYLHIFLVSGLFGLGALLLGLGFVYQGLWQKAGADLRATDELTRAFVLGSLTALLVQLTSVSFYGRVPLILAVLLGGARVIRSTEARFYRPPKRSLLWEIGQQRRVAAEGPAAAGA